jgi:ubiquinone/menaquinone biosynthesis C-methylase UbiE
VNKKAKFWDRVAEKYARQPIGDEAAYQKKLQVTRNYFRPDMQVLEIGCGTGSTAIAHAPCVEHIRATDISAKMIDIARSRAAEAGVDNVSFEVAAVEDLQAAGPGVDAVLALSLLHLVDDREAVIARVHRMLQPGGIFVSNTACLGDRMRYMRPILPIGRMLGLMPLVKVFTVQQLESSLTGAGFAIDYRWRPEQGVAVFMVAHKATE